MTFHSPRWTHRRRSIRRLLTAASAVTVALAALASLTDADTSSIVPAAAIDPAPTEPRAAAIAHVVAHAPEFGLSPTDVADLVVTDVVPSAGSSIVYLQQRHGGVPVADAIATVVVEPSGHVRRVASRLANDLDHQKRPTAPAITATEAATAARGDETPQPDAGDVPSIDVDEPVPPKLVLQPDVSGDLRLAWEVTVHEAVEDSWWQVRVDAKTGEELDRVSLNSADSYNVFAAPIESPSVGGRSIVTNPADPTASPFGWHDTNGVAGAESTLTEGNNASAYTDVDNNNIIDPASQPDGGPSLDFDRPLDLAQAPLTYRDADVVNLFYLTNHIHDVLYRFGFDEASGNFQVNNYGRGGLGGDAVKAEAQNGGSVNNANFTTFPDGFAPRMQMYLFDPANPDRSGSLDSSVVIHEYGHGLTNRLTGGPSTVSCLQNGEEAGEGWSDWLGLMLTMQPTDTGPQPRGFATYLLGQPTSGPGLRAYRYSTDLGVDPRTYDSIKTASGTHAIGSTFATMLWEMSWGLIDRYGFTSDLQHGNAGNTMALQLMVDGLKLQPCNPGFIDARDAILLADELRYDGANQCLLWDAFAKRGLGWSAAQGSPFSATDGTEAFDLPPQCAPLMLTVETDPAEAVGGAPLTYNIAVTNTSSSAMSSVTATAVIPPQTSLQAGSITCNGTAVSGIVEFAIGALAPGQSTTCAFTVVVDAGVASTVLFADDFEQGVAAWQIDHGLGVTDWSLASNQYASATHAMFAPDPVVPSDLRLTTAAPLAITAGSVLRFTHRYDTEHPFDGGVVEASTDGVNWSGLDAHFFENGYNSTIEPGANPLANQRAFSGSSHGFVRSAIDLSSFDGSSIRLRFRMGSDASVGGAGWYVDDVRLADETTLDSAVGASSFEGHVTTRTHSTVAAPGAPAALCAGLAVTVDLGLGGVPTAGDDVIMG
ncbi:MAG: M36 family metallopeptidase, partial [Acidimicrobiia bacterium]